MNDQQQYLGDAEQYLGAVPESEEKDRLQSELDELWNRLEEYFGEGAFTIYISDYLNREREKWVTAQQTPDHESPTDPARSDPLCTCKDIGCKVKAGKIPAGIRNELRRRTSLKKAFAEYKSKHGGDAAALTEAVEQFLEERNQLKRDIQRVLGEAKALAGDGTVQVDVTGAG